MKLALYFAIPSSTPLEKGRPFIHLEAVICLASCLYACLATRLDSARKIRLGTPPIKETASRTERGPKGSVVRSLDRPAFSCPPCLNNSGLVLLDCVCWTRSLNITTRKSSAIVTCVLLGGGEHDNDARGTVYASSETMT